jgi:hypothetical protein
VELLEQAWRESQLPDGNPQGVSAAQEKFKRITKLLHRLIGILDPKQRTLEPSPVSDLSSLIQSTRDGLKNIIKQRDAADNDPAKGLVSATGKMIEGICVKVTPFLKIFLSVAVQGSAVLPGELLVLPLDTSPQSLRPLMQWSLYAYQG